MDYKLSELDFFHYCCDFYYKETGLYPIADYDEIAKAVKIMVKHPKYCGDSVDRERVRALIEAHQLIEELNNA
jgi:hypothetical protein